MEILIIVAIVFWIIVSIIVGTFGQQRSIGFAGAFFASLLLSPILAMLFVIASEKIEPSGIIVKEVGLIGNERYVEKRNNNITKVLFCLGVIGLISLIFSIV